MFTFIQSFAKPVIYLTLVLMSIAIVYSFVRPQQVTELLKRAISTRAGLIAAVLVRLVFGLTLFSVADDSHYPTTIKTIALILICSAFLITFIGRRRLAEIIQWFELRGPLFMRIWLALGLIFVGFIFYALR